MDANLHTVIVGASTVAGAYFENNGGFPVISKAIGKPLGTATDIVIGAVVFYVGHKIDHDGVSDVVQGLGLGYALGAVLSYVGL